MYQTLGIILARRNDSINSRDTLLIYPKSPFSYAERHRKHSLILLRDETSSFSVSTEQELCPVVLREAEKSKPGGKHSMWLLLLPDLPPLYHWSMETK